MSALIKSTRKYYNGFMITNDSRNREWFIEELKVAKLMQVPMPQSLDDECETQLEYANDEPAISVCLVTQTRVGVHNVPLSEYLEEKAHYGWADHDQTIERLSTFNASAQRKATASRSIHNVSINYRRDPQLPNDLGGSTSMALLNRYGERHEGRNHERTSFAPSISTPDQRKNHRTVKINHHDKSKDDRDVRDRHYR